MATILYVPVEIGTAFTGYELATAYNGITNLANLLNRYAEVTIRSDSAGNKTECNCAPSLDGYKFNSFTLPLDVWTTIVNDIATNIAADAGLPITSYAQYVAPYFVNLSHWVTSGWTADAAGAFYAARNPIISARFVPSGSQGGNTSLRGNVGFFGNTVVDGANTVTMGGLSALNGKNITVTISGVDGSGNYTSAGAATSAVTDGIFSASISATITPSDRYFVGITSVSIFAKTDFGGSVFRTNIGFGKDFTGANAGLMIDQWGVIGA